MHVPVLLKETIEILNPEGESLVPYGAGPQEGKFIIDGTIGSGGHAAKIFERILPDGKILGIDWDVNSLKNAELKILAEIKNQKSKIKNNLILVNGNYADLSEILEKYNLPKADGLLLDLGMSSDQLEHSSRGFSFLRDEPLDMRYSGKMQRANGKEQQNLTAAEVINSFSEKELANIFWKYGEERYSRQIAKRIVEERRKKRILTTFDLVAAINKSYRTYKTYRLHPATKVFQALRIYVNGELDNLEKALKNLTAVLKPEGRAVIISFHSLEDRLVKNYFKMMVKEKKAEFLTRKPIRPTEKEIGENPRARSAKMRALSIISSH